MRLNVKHKQALTKTDKQKKANAAKKSKGPKLLKDYMDTSESSIDNTILNLTQMRYGTIGSCEVDMLKIPEGTIQIKHSWLEVLLLMLSTVIVNNPDGFEKQFEDNTVTSMFFVVDKVYGKYSFDKEQYKAYKIPNTEYYLEYLDTSASIFEALVGLTKCLGIPLDQIEFHLRNKLYSNSKLRFDILEEKESIVTIDKLPEMLKTGIHMTSVEVLGEVVKAHSMDVALLAICNKLYDEYGGFRLSTLSSNNSTGIKVLENGDELNKHIVKLRDSEVGVYCDGDINGIIQFISDSMMQLGMEKDSIRFKFRALKDKSELKEWEVE